jgi:sporulation protein YlmC with PRC-barrel domain
MEVQMSLKSGASLTALVLAAGLSLPAAAQTPPTQQKPAASAPAPAAPVAGQIVTQDGNTILAKDLIGQTVHGTDQAKIGTISDLILSKDGKSVQGFVIGVGGFLGIGEKSVALQMDRLRLDSKPDGSTQLVMDAKKEELAKAPSFKSRKDQEAEKQAAADAERARSRTPSPGGSAPRPGN